MDHGRRFLGGLSAETFLREYWQKQPLLVRGAVADYRCPIEADELAGLACEEEVESRIVVHDGTTWHLEHGPFIEPDFAARGDRNWTLLVQDLEEHMPEVGHLLQELDFLPAWRIDDVMASFAAVGGSVGPHFDEYDVFLLQVEGQRRWQISTDYERHSLRTDTDLRILQTFEAQHEWLLEPGDMLYLPPHVAHFGVATSPCMTFSLGCRAPSVTELVAQYAAMVLARCSESERYRDADSQVSEATSGLSDRAVARATAIVHRLLTPTPDIVARSLATLATTPKSLFKHDEAEYELEEVNNALSSPAGLWRRKGSRWTWYCGEQTYLYVNGREYEVLPGATTQPLEKLCKDRHFEHRWLRSLTPPYQSVVRQLVRDGLLLPDE